MTHRSVSRGQRTMSSPGHICAFFNSREQEYATLVPYFRDGIDQGEQVVNIVDEGRWKDHVGRLTASGLNVSPETIDVRTSEETYLLGGAFDMERMCDFVQGALDHAKANGKRVRTAGVMDWLSRDGVKADQVLEYEARMNTLVPAYDCTFMCVYDLSALNGETVVDILATHKYAIVNGAIRENSFYVPPEIYLEQCLPWVEVLRSPDRATRDLSVRVARTRSVTISKASPRSLSVISAMRDAQQFASPGA